MNENSISQTREKVTERDPNSDIDWISLVVNIDLLSLRILEKFYRNIDPKKTECYVFDHLFKELKGLRVSSSTLWRRCYEMQEKGLLKIIERTSPLLIWPVNEIEDNVRKMITHAYSRILGEDR